MNKTINLYWTRHAESCSNLMTNTYQDKLDDEEENKYFKIFIDSLYKLYKLICTVNVHPLLSYIGMQHAIRLGMNLKNLNIDFDYIFASTMIRTIITAMVAFRGTNKKIYVMPYIHEIGPKYLEYFIEQPQEMNELKMYVKFIKKWLELNWIVNFDDIEVIDYINILKNDFKSNKFIMEAINLYNVNKLDSIKKIYELLNQLQLNNKHGKIKKFFYIIQNDKLRKKFIRGPHVIFPNTNDYVKTNNFNKFIKIADSVFNFKNNENIICFSHGNAIIKYITDNYPNFCKNPNNCIHPMNTKMYKESININNNNIIHTDINIFYEPIKIRKYFNEFEKINENICDIIQ